MKVFLHGKDNVQWSIDSDRKYTEIFLKNIGLDITPSLFNADVVHSVWWNLLLQLNFIPYRRKTIIAVASNDIDVRGTEFNKAKKWIDLWIAPNRAMYDKLTACKVNVKYQPFYVDENIFYKLNISRESLANELGFDADIIKNKLIIGSFQRDSEGKDLSKPKWQKGPDVLIDILSQLPKDKFILLLAGPRRHWIINQCKQLKIPYLYYGKEMDKYVDDIHINNIDKYTINKLYNMTDIYVVSSKNEGGPKAVLESAFSKTMIISTNVGLAPDFLHPWCIYNTVDEGIQKMNGLINNELELTDYITSNYNSAMNVASYVPVKDRWNDIYNYIKSKYNV